MARSVDERLARLEDLAETLLALIYNPTAGIGGGLHVHAEHASELVAAIKAERLA